jgi:alcohol dehydrogenase class IV
LLPCTIEFAVRGSLPSLCAEIAGFSGLLAADEAKAAESLAVGIRDLAGRVGQPTSLQEAGIKPKSLESDMAELAENALNDNAMVVAMRFAEEDEVEKLHRYAFDGQPDDF